MNHQTELYCDYLVAGAYFVITAQLIQFLRNPKVLAIFDGRSQSKRTRVLFHATGVVFFLFAAFIALCGATHLVHGLHHVYPGNKYIAGASAAIMGMCAAISVLTAILSYALFPMIADALQNVQVDAHGKLTLAESYMVEIVNMLKESVVVLTPDSRIVRGNEPSAAIFGRPFLGTAILPLVHREDRHVFETTLAQVLDGAGSEHNTPISIEYRVNSPESSVTCTTAGGSPWIWVESTFCKGTHMNSDGTIEYDVKMITRNIDDRKRGARYRQYYEAAKEKELINEAKLRYISCVAHDLKTPLQSFCFTIDLLKQSDLSTDQTELLEQANVAVDLMKLTISQTMDISKALTGAKLQPRRTSVLLSSVIERVRIIITGYGKQVPVSFHVAPEISDAIITDEEWLWQMLLNLLTNACKYTDSGSIDCRVSVTAGHASEKTSNLTFPSMPPIRRGSHGAVMDMSVITNGRNLLFEVIDTGVGIRDDKLDSVFEAFSQVQSGQVTGTGLGLFGVRRRVEGLQGTCGVRHNTTSPTGTGTVVWFSIPYVVDHTESILAAASSDSAITNGGVGARLKRSTSMRTPISPSRVAELIRGRNLTAMVVDDTLTIRKLMEKSLLQLGFAQVTGYENGSKGLTAMMEQQVDVVFTDVQMPIMTGPEMARRFRLFERDALNAGHRTVRQTIVAVSANKPDSGDTPDDLFDFVCSKPLSREDLTRLVLHRLAPMAADASHNV